MIHIPENKQPQHQLSSQSYLNPKKLYLPLSQHTGKPSKLCLKKGDMVNEGQIIAAADGFVSAALHAPCSGKISDITVYNHPILKKFLCLVIQCAPEKREYPEENNWKMRSREELHEVLAGSGIVGLGGAAFPTHVKLKPPKKIDTLIINGCECEPYLATDNRMMIEYCQQIVYGIEIICKLIQPNQVIIAIEKNKPLAIKKMGESLSQRGVNLPQIKLSVLKTAYPQGGEKQLIYNTSGRIVAGGKLPLDVGCLVQNVATCFAIYEAVAKGKPLIERLVGFYGDALKEPKNIWVKIGTTLRELFEEKVLEYACEPEKIICGGPMMGVSIKNLDYPIIKGNGGFLFLRRSDTKKQQNPCIRCARCVDACPMSLLPLEYVKLVKAGRYEELKDLYIRDCIECGCCSYVCPASIPIVHYIKMGKAYGN